MFCKMHKKVTNPKKLNQVVKVSVNTRSLKITICNTYRHLARNPFYCDCSATWLLDWMSVNPVETSGVRCEEPKKHHKKKMSSLKPDQLKCKQFVYKSPFLPPHLYCWLLCWGFIEIIPLTTISQLKPRRIDLGQHLICFEANKI